MQRLRLTIPPCAAVTAIAVTFGFLACSDQPATAPPAVGIEAAKGGPNGDPKVNAVDPDTATQDTTLDVTVTGSGYDEGTGVTFELGGVFTGKVVTNSTRFVNSRKLIANITIAVDADTGLYDVVAMTSKGRKGIGTEMFEVKTKPPKPACPVSSPECAPIGVSVHNFTGGLSTSQSTTGDVLSDGRLWVVTTDRVCVDFRQDLVIDSPSDWQEFQDLSGQDPLAGPVCSVDVTLHTRDHSNEATGKMLGEFNGIEYAGGKVVFKDFNVSKQSSWEWRVIFDTWKGQADATPVGEGVCIELTTVAPPREWLIYNGCTARDGAQIDAEIEFWRNRPRVGATPGAIVLVATFTMPFSFVVTEQLP